MKRSRVASSIAVAALTAGVLAGCTTAKPDEGVGIGEDLEGRVLTVSTWGSSFSESGKTNFFEPFSEETGVEVRYLETGSEPTAQVLLQAQEGRMDVDLIESGNPGVLLNLDLIQPWPDDLRAVFDETMRPETVQDSILDYATTAAVIVCNPELVKKCPTNAEEFWDVENFPGDRGFNTLIQFAFPFALLADGVAPDDLLPLDIDRAISKLEEIKPDIKVWADSGARQEQMLTDKEVGIAWVWNGRANVVKNNAVPDLQFEWGDSVLAAGTGWTVPKDAPNADVAFAFLKWFAEHPEAQAQWTTEQGLPTPTKDLESLVSPEILAILPTVQPGVVSVPYVATAPQMSALQKAWQTFLAGG